MHTSSHFWPAYAALSFLAGMFYDRKMEEREVRKKLQASCHHSFRIETDKIGPQVYKTKVCTKCSFKEFHDEEDGRP